jgi:signal transduction histidine kinase
MTSPSALDERIAHRRFGGHGMVADHRAVTRGRWSTAIHSAGVKLVAAYVALLALVAGLTVLVERRVLEARLVDRVEAGQAQELLELERFAATAGPFASTSALFDAFQERNVPDSEEATLAFIRGRLHTSDMARFPLAEVPGSVIASWAARSRGPPTGPTTVRGRYDTPHGTAHFLARRYAVGSGTPGWFVVTTLPAAEQREIDELSSYGLLGTFAVLIACSACAWLVVRRLLRPMRALTQTARSISRSDLRRRVAVTGTDDAAEMATSFNGMLDRLEGVLRRQREFVHGAGHELRQPITICRGHLELLDGDLEAQRATVGLVIDELKRMGRIVEDLEVLADTEQPDFLRPEPFVLELFAHELVAKAAALAPRRWELDAPGAGSAVADRQLLTEAVMNLAHNAVQHTTPGDTVAIGVEGAGEELRIWVRDTGCGIAAVDRRRVLEPFQRGEGSQRRYRGSGLGLAIVDAVAKAHGGRVEIDSRVGHGTKLTIVLDRKEVDGSWPGC